MFLLDFAAWFFYAAEEDGQMPILFGVLVEAVLAVVVATVIHRLTDTREIERRVSRLEDAMAGAVISHQQLEQRLEVLEDEGEE